MVVYYSLREETCLVSPDFRWEAVIRMKDDFGLLTAGNLELFTDLYELTMMESYFQEDHNPEATFDLFVRDLPENRNYLIATGLQQAISYLDNLSFSDEALNYLGGQSFDPDFLSHLEDLEFTGDVRAVPEGTPIFPNEPLIEVTAPILQAQLFETLLINQVGFQTLIASKAARMRSVIDRFGDDQSLVDFGSRRAHGTDAGIKAARAAYIGGFNGTSNVAAGQLFDLPIMGTMAHSWVESFPTEREAFEVFADRHREETILLVDTYDTLEGTRLARDLIAEKDYSIRGIRLDSGNLTELSKNVREIAPEFDVFVSSGVDEYFIRDFLKDGGVASGFGVGTKLVTSADAPRLEGVYKLMAVRRNGSTEPVMKLSAGKVTYPGRKSIKRVTDGGTYRKDILTLRNADEPGEELFVDVFENGSLVYDSPDPETIRDTRSRNVSHLPEPARAIDQHHEYPVEIGTDLQSLQERTEREINRSGRTG